MSVSNKKVLQQARKTIENAMELAEEERRRKLLSRRIDLARAGLLAYQNGKIIEAVKSFQAYLRIVEDIKNVSEGGLKPDCFDQKKELPEVLMISGIYWDLAKIYDRTHSAESQREFYHFMEKYIQFSKGLPFQPVCAESLRKYLQYERPMHKNEFKNAYRLLSDSQCFIVTSLIDVTASQTLPIFWNFRDRYLRQYRVGRSFIAWYYRRGPGIALQVNALPPFARKALGKGLDSVAFLMKYCTNSLGSKDKLAVRKADPEG